MTISRRTFTRTAGAVAALAAVPGAEARWMGPAEFAPFVRGEVIRLPKILADIGVQPQ